MRMATSRHRLGAAVIAGLLVLHGCGTPQQSAAPDPSTSAGSAAPRRVAPNLLRRVSPARRL